MDYAFNEMARDEAGKILRSFESGYIETATHPDVVKACEVLGRSARISKYPSLANPTQSLAVRSVTNRYKN